MNWTELGRIRTAGVQRENAWKTCAFSECEPLFRTLERTATGASLAGGRGVSVQASKSSKSSNWRKP